uniref:Uncharacterized protein n=1 Tax=Polytomella parva TaxID=51329 RepID=A0A7S0YHL7_9CHLO
MAADIPEKVEEDQEYTWLQQQMAAQAAQVEEEVEDEEMIPIALYDAAEQGDLEGIKNVFQEYPSINISTAGPDGDTALHLACLYGHNDVVEALIEKGADVNAINAEDGSTTVHDAAAGGYLEICKKLLARGNVEMLMSAVDEDGDIPLHHASRGDHLEVVQYFISLNADPTKRNKEGRTPAQESESEEVKKFLQQIVADRVRAAMQASNQSA